MDLIERFMKFVVAKVLEHCRPELEIIERDVTTLEKTVAMKFPRVPYDLAIKILKGHEKVNGKTTIETLENDLAELNAKIETGKQQLAEKEAKLKDVNLKKGERNFIQASYDQLVNDVKELESQAENYPGWLESARTFEYGNDLGGSDETVLTRMFEVPIMVYNWPHEVKAFYMKRDAENPHLAKGVDVLAPEGYGEVVGGGERETNKELLIEKINEHGLPMSAFEWYLDLRRFGSVPHAGFGLGLERMVAWICKLKHIRETIPFPRMYGRLLP